MQDVHRDCEEVIFKVKTGHPHILFSCFKNIFERFHLEMPKVDKFI